jgi:ribose/xylose/arabinose/galactoside ABC-type transport system permease subunit
MSAGSIPLAQEQPARSWAVWSLEHREFGIFAFLLLLAGAFALTSSNFATLANANTIALNASILVVVACAETVVVLTRNFDLSVGSIVALSSYVGLDLFDLQNCQKHQQPPLLFTRHGRPPPARPAPATALPSRR